MSVITDRKRGAGILAGAYTYYLPAVLSASDYYAFGMEMPGRTYQSSNYRYGFNGKENDRGNWSATQLVQDYGMRLYNPALGKFLSVDPIAKQYPELTPYQFASNTPIMAIDLDGLEKAHYTWSTQTPNTTSEPKTANYKTTEADRITAWELVNKAPIKTAKDGYGTPERHQFSLLMKETKEQFAALKETYTVAPEILHNKDNYLAEYMHIENPYDNDKYLGEGDGMLIDIALTMNAAVRFTNVTVTENSFSITANTLDLGTWAPIPDLTNGMNYNHPDAGQINFSGSFDEKNNTINFKIDNTTTLGSVFSRLFTCASRNVQCTQWEQVLDNVQESISTNKKEVISKTHQKDNDKIENLKQ